MLYFYHYTSEKAYKVISATNAWRCEERQPQKGSWYTDQHQKGFYVTCLSPDQLSAKASRKTGGGVAGATHVFVFQFDVSEKALKKGGVALPNAEGSASIKHVGSPAKYCVTNTGKSKAEGFVSFSETQCIWSGLVEKMPTDFQNKDEVAARMISQSPP